MPYANNNGVKIYYEVEGQGPPLVLHCGSGGLIATWREWGYVDGLRNDYRLVMLDPRGHGSSDKPHDPGAYASEQRVGDVIAVLDDLRADRVHFCGYSYGGRVAFELAKLAPRRLISVIAGGVSARAKNPDSPAIRQQIQFYESGSEAFKTIVAAFEKSFPVSPELRDRLLANDAQALIAMLKAPWESLVEDLPHMTMPFLVLVGEKDFSFAWAKEDAARLPNATFVSLPGLDHLGAMSASVFVPLVKEFLAKVSNA